MDVLWTPFREVAAVAYPVWDDRGTKARWVLHLVFWGVLLTLLWQVNALGGLERVLRSPWPGLHRFWLPLVAVALYPIGWLALGLWTALREKPEAGGWPLIESAWRETTSALEQAGIDAAATPTFLVLGPLTPETRALLTGQGATPLGLRAAAPFQVFAQHQAIFIACASLKASVDDAGTAPLQYLCSVLLRERAPRHPLQGVIVVLPFDADDARQAVAACREELQAIRAATYLEAPIHVVVRGMPEGPAPLDGLMLRFPPLPDLDPAEVASMVRRGFDWLCLDE
ncbi:MAG TPA: hypothetical protein VFE62_22085, partial [Gemmataceae bacterium]|nr:hypothetical protein [Gemmataceae bacterium]